MSDFATGERARTFKGVSPGLLSPLGIMFGLLVAFIAAQVWGDVDRGTILFLPVRASSRPD